MSDLLLSDIDFKNKMALVSTTHKVKQAKIENRFRFYIRDLSKNTGICRKMPEPLMLSDNLSLNV